MKLDYSKDIINNKVIVMVSFKEYGTALLSATDEENLILNWNPKIEYKDLNFKRYIKVVENEPVEDKSVTNYTNTLSITLPTSVVANPVNAGSKDVIIGTKTISVAIADVTSGIATQSEIETAILNAVKTDTTILALYSASDISVSSGKIVASKSVTEDPIALVSAINTVFGTNSVVSSNATTYTGVQVGFTPINLPFAVDKTLSLKFEIDVTTIATHLLSPILSSVEMYGQALGEVFRVVIKDAVKAKLEDLRSKNNKYEGVTEEIL
jgi:hypothetical protein